MINITVRANQDIFDVCLQEYGTLELLNQLISDNDLNFDGEITQGQVLKIDETVSANKDVKDFFELNKKNPQNNYIFKNDIPPFNWDNANIKFDTTLKTFDSIQL